MKPVDYQHAGVITDLEREVLDLRYLHGFSWRQISLALNRHRSTVRSRHMVALDKIRDYETRKAA